MATLITPPALPAVSIPAWVIDLDSFRRWVRSDELPEVGRYSYLAGELWTELAVEELFTHNRVKTKFSTVLDSLVDARNLGYFFSDGIYWTNVDADVSTVPDALFFRRETLQEGKVRLVEGARNKYIEVEGTPDLVLEVVSDSSARKDTKVLLEKYWAAGVFEYWLVDARSEQAKFQILTRSAEGYNEIMAAEGWLASQVLGAQFRLTQGIDELGYPQFKLAVRE